ncbi:hypothetical protein ACFQ7O_35665 [Streptomyces sp. NPDC056485]|uniref:hypothetical protein n=1 Tax=Streptomyces sp. NPDC056485 TaxID=3345834 RepID=UPI00368BCF49
MGRRKAKPPKRPRVSAAAEAAVTEALGLMFPAPVSTDWRADVLGAETLSMRAGRDGWPLMNGHRVTEEMCEALQAERPEEAHDFQFADLVAMAEMMGPPTFHGPVFGQPW